ncbi:MAG: V-type ATP synthase subunit K [Planctomycetes bacterium]|nr:V-type ATP synthase subunit K [Planctomycetota bacterium]
MDTSLFFGQMGTALAIGLAAVGSALGCGIAGQSAAGAWAKDAKAGKGIRFIYVILVALPITQTLYGMIVMNGIAEKLAVAGAHGGLLFGIGLATGLGELLSAWMQGAIGAAGCRMLSESDGKGFALVIIAMGIAESVGLLVFVFMRGPLGTIVVGG